MAVNEIGGYLELEHFTGQEYHSGLIALNTARHALLYLIQAKQIKKLYLPYFLCSSVSAICEKNKVNYEFYSIDKKFCPIFDLQLGRNEYLYIVNYYGQFDKDKIALLKQQYGNIIIDNVQAFFQRPLEGVDTIYSCRKFFGVPDGGYLYTDGEISEELEQDYSGGRMKHLLGRLESSASEYYSEFRANDESFRDVSLRSMSTLTHNILRGIDYEFVKRKREENYETLAAALGKHNKLEFIAPGGPYCYPFYCENGMRIKKELAQQKVYVPTLWPNVLELNGTQEKDYAENILPLPCDQRYGMDDMIKISDILLMQTQS